MSLPSFINVGDNVPDNETNFISLASGETIEIVPLTGINPPPGETPTGKNCIISFDQYALWIDNLPEGQRSPIFPAIGGPGDPGKLLGLQPRFRAFMLCMTKDDAKESIYPFTISVFKQLREIEEAIGEPIKGKVIRISRTGEALKTRYSVIYTGKQIEVTGEPTLDLVDYVGPTTREEIIKMLSEVGQWPPKGGDPYASA